MATMNTTVRQRDLTRKYATLTVTVNHPAHHRFLYWLGMQVMTLGARIVGFAAVDVREGGEAS